MQNDQGKLIQTRTPKRWRVSIDYRKLNAVTRKDQLPPPFIDQILGKLAGQSFYYFLEGYSRYNQVSIHPEDQEKTIFVSLWFLRLPKNTVWPL